MSKTKLKKELQQLSREQLMQLVLDAYSARKDIKMYFEYFLNPDPEALFRKAVDAVRKECARQKWTFSKFRVSVLRKCIADFASYQPGDDYVQRLRLTVIAELLLLSSRLRTTDVQARAFAAFVSDFMNAADAYGNVSEALAELRKLHDTRIGSRTFLQLLRIWPD